MFMVNIKRLFLVTWILVVDIIIAFFLIFFEKIKGFKVFPGS